MPIICPHCSREFPTESVPSRHKGSCPGWIAQGLAESEPCLCGLKTTSHNKMKEHYKTCETWLSRDKKAVADKRKKQTFLKNYGVENPQQAPEIREKSKQTNLERYGVENPFQSEACMEKSKETMIAKYGVEFAGQSEVLQEQMRKTNLERYGAENPFASEEIKGRIRTTLMEKHGASNPQQAPEIRLRTRKTNQERYGGELLGSPELREKSRATNLERYGVEFAGGAPEVQAKIIATNLVRYGVRHTCMDPEVRRKQLETMELNYGSHYFASEEGKAAIKQAMLDRYGVEHYAKIEGFWEGMVLKFQERYGVDHPLQLPEFKAKAEATLIDRYGTPIPGLRNRGPNNFERKIQSLLPDGVLLFTGDGSWWRKLPKLGQNKNPDFIVPGLDPLHPHKGVVKVVEAFGCYWHSRMFTGKANFEHESELIDAYSEVGIECLVIWESEVNGDADGVRVRLEEFLGRLDSPGFLNCSRKSR